MPELNVLIVDDDPQLVRILQAVLKPLGAELRVAGTGRLALQELLERPPAIMLLDMRLPDMPGLEVLAEVARRGRPVTVVVMTAHGSVDLAVQAMREGAYDFLTKPLDLERLKVMVRNAIERHRMIAELDDYKSQYERVKFRGLLGSSPAMLRLYRQLRAVGSGSGPVLVAGAEGTELEACARSLHAEGPAPDAAFVAVRCKGATPAALAEAGAAASGGTLCLEGVEELRGDAAQAALDLARGGAPDGGRLRVVATAGPALDQPLRPGSVEEELKLMFETARVNVPKLSERAEDVLDLAEHFLERQAKELERSFTGFDGDAQAALAGYAWPGNVAELERVVADAARANEGSLVTRAMLPERVAAAAPAGAAAAERLRGLAAAGTVRPLWQVEKDEIEKAQRLTDGNVVEAARLLEVSPGTIYRKQKAWTAR
ncbi:MAG: response regulator [Candidatus Sumerlaeia bacterium]|nr:response regulator [Candidatus Sumerlaeia bacterium]